LEKPENLHPSWGDWEDLTHQQKEMAIYESEYSIDVEEWKEIYPWLTWDFVQEAARYLDRTTPSWREPGRNYGDVELVIKTVAQLHPELNPDSK
jgi:hypothetical protein